MEHSNDVHFAVGWILTTNHEIIAFDRVQFLAEMWPTLKASLYHLQVLFMLITMAQSLASHIPTYSLDNRHQNCNDTVFCCIDILHLMYCDILVNCDTLAYRAGQSEECMKEVDTVTTAIHYSSTDNWCFLENSADFLWKMNRVTLDRQEKMVSFDVVSLFTKDNIDILYYP